MDHTNKKAPAPTKTQDAFETDTNDLDSATGDRQSKELSTLLARLALAGHYVILGKSNDFTVCKYGFAQYCQNPLELRAFALKLGVRNV